MTLEMSRRSGVSTLIANSRWRQRRLLILCYHGVSIDDEHEWSDLYVSQGHLDRRLGCLRRAGFEVLSLQDGIVALKDGTLPERAVCLTFDDGASDFSRRAMPVLNAHALHATLYLTTYYVERRLPVFDTALSYMMWKGQGRSARMPLGLGRLDVPNGEGFRTLHAHIRLAVRASSMDAEEKNAALRVIATDLGVDFDQFEASGKLQLMTPAEVISLPPASVALELHTHRHRTPRDEVAFRQEILDNRAAFARLGLDAGKPRHFCYPSGDYAPEFRNWLASEGVVSATTCDVGLATQHDDPFFLPRVIDSELIPQEMFLGWLTGVAELLPHRRRSA
jgi:peptidoglycan/xylan/chitin deacetylase (PgdA/CDA1 family)